MAGRAQQIERAAPMSLAAIVERKAQYQAAPPPMALEMGRIPGNAFFMGSDHHYPEDNR
jgi:hypothetical protein